MRCPVQRLFRAPRPRDSSLSAILSRLCVCAHCTRTWASLPEFVALEMRHLPCRAGRNRRCWDSFARASPVITPSPGRTWLRPTERAAERARYRSDGGAPRAVWMRSYFLGAGLGSSAPGSTFSVTSGDGPPRCRLAAAAASVCREAPCPVTFFEDTRRGGGYMISWPATIHPPARDAESD